MPLKYKKEILSLTAVVIVIVIVFSSLTAYAGTWPPAVVVESNSMQHGSNYVFGVINTGDIVALKKESSIKNIQTYLQAREDGGPKNYGEFGQVIIYINPLLHELVIHRAIFYVESWNGNSPILFDNNNPSWLTITGPDVYINDVGYSHKNLLVNLQGYVGETGFVTMGDFNFANSGIRVGNYSVAADQNANIDNSLVTLSQVVGIAVGYLPFVGVFKLWFTGHTMYIPGTSNIAMALIIVAIVALIIVPVPLVDQKKGTKNRR